MDEKSNEKEVSTSKSVSKKVTSAVSMALKCTEMVMKSQDKISIPKLLSQKMENKADILIPAQVEPDEQTFSSDVEIINHEDEKFETNPEENEFKLNLPSPPMGPPRPRTPPPCWPPPTTLLKLEGD